MGFQKVPSTARLAQCLSSLSSYKCVTGSAGMHMCVSVCLSVIGGPDAQLTQPDLA